MSKKVVHISLKTNSGRYQIRLPIEKVNNRVENQPCRAVLFTRFPAAGHAKTRLIPAIGPDGAAAVHRILTERTVATLKSSNCQVEIRYTGADKAAFGKWLGDDLTFVAQAEGDLTTRLLDALQPTPVLFFGSDTPELKSHHIEQAITALHDHDVVVGPAEDGGYYCIGVNGSYPFLFEDMPWSTDQVLPETLRRVAERRLTCKLLETLSDCDTPDDLARWPWLTA